jgi:hypothetical protein
MHRQAGREVLGELRSEGAVDITADAPCWTPDGTPCQCCGGARVAEMAVPDERPVPLYRQPGTVASPAAQGALW